MGLALPLGRACRSEDAGGGSWRGWVVCANCGSGTGCLPVLILGLPDAPWVLGPGPPSSAHSDSAGPGGTTSATFQPSIQGAQAPSRGFPPTSYSRQEKKAQFTYPCILCLQRDPLRRGKSLHDPYNSTMKNNHLKIQFCFEQNKLIEFYTCFSQSKTLLKESLSWTVELAGRQGLPRAVASVWVS